MYYTKEQIANIKQETFAYLIVEEKDHVLNVTLNREDKRNALTPIMVNELAFALSYAYHSSSVWAIVIDAKGPVFCAGADMRAFSGKEEENNSTIPKPEKPVLLGEIFIECHKPCIAKVDGPAYAGAFLILCGCHYVIASEKAKFGLLEVKRGIWPMQVMESLLQIIPARKVLDWCMLGKTVSTAEAHSLGLVTNAVNSSNINEEVAKLTTEICSNSPSAIKYGLKAFDELRSIEKSQAHTYLNSMLREVLKTKDAAEGITAFKEKREPVWTGE